MARKRVIHLGCGQAFDPRFKKAEDIEYIANDIAELPGINWAFDLNKLPWAFGSCSTDYILAVDILEHLTNPKLILEKIYRLLKPCGVVEIQVPYFGSLAHANDMTHVHGFTPNSFVFYIPGHPYCNSSPWYSYARIKLNKLQIDNQPLQSYVLEKDLKRKILNHEIVGNIQIVLTTIKLCWWGLCSM